MSQNIDICAYCGSQVAKGYMNQHLARCEKYDELMRKLRSGDWWRKRLKRMDEHE